MTPDTVDVEVMLPWCRLSVVPHREGAEFKSRTCLVQGRNFFGQGLEV
jgi:hypothetical protein